MGTQTYPKAPRPTKKLEIQSTTQPSFITEDTTGKQVYGRGTGQAAAVETLELPPKRPDGHNTITNG